MRTGADRLDGRSRELAERALGFPRIDADRLAQLLHARHDRVADRLAAHLDLRGDGLDPADQKFLEARNASIECRRDLERPRPQALVDLVCLGVQRVCKRSTAGIDRAAPLVDTFFDGAPENAVAAILGGEGSKLSDEQLERIADLVKKSRTKR